MDTLLTKKLVENEAVFRKYNEKVETAFDELDEMAAEEGYDGIFNIDNNELKFFCECSDENCKKRVSMKLKTYSEIHKIRDQFTIVPGHEVAGVEVIIRSTQNYLVVKKYVKPSENPGSLNDTPINNK